VPSMATRLKALRVEKYGLRSRAALGREVGVSGNTIKFWEDGGKPKGEVLQKVADVLGVSVRYLLTGDEEPAETLRRMAGKPVNPEEGVQLVEQLLDMMGRFIPNLRELLAERESDEPLTRVPPHERADELASHAWDMPVMIVSTRDIQPGQSTEFYALPLLDDPVAAGEPREVRDRHVSGYCIVHRNWCPHLAESVFLRVKGDSMIPTIPDGAFVCLDLSECDPTSLAGRVVLIVTHDGEATIKRLRRTNRGEWVGIPDNLSDANRPIYIMEGDRVVGLVRSVHAEVK